MSIITRRNLLQGAVVVPMALPFITLGPVPQTPVKTLIKLASEGKFMSSPLHIPEDVHKGNWVFFLDGISLKDGPYKNRFLKEIYAPGDESGYVVMYLESDEDGFTAALTEVIHGNWSFRDMPDD